MPTLEFKGKSFVYAHHLSVPFRELLVDEQKSLPPKGQKPVLDDNLIIHGDNLHALKALLPVYAGKVDCIYIDPPYNTGNEGWCYNDNVRSPVKAAELVEKAESIEQFEGSRFDKVTKTVEDGALVVTGEKRVVEKTEGLGGSFTFVTLGPEMTLDKLMADGLPAFESLAKYVFFTATGRKLSDVPKQKTNTLGFIGETEVYRVHLHYQPDKKWLESNDAALTEKLVDAMVAANPGKKKLLVFAAAKFMSQRELSRQGIEFCQLPYAIHRILGD